MESKKVYLDNNATTMLDPQAKELMESYFAKIWQSKLLA